MVGTVAWAAAGGAPLDFRQKAGYLLDATVAYLQELPGELRWVLSSRGLFPAAKVDAVGVEDLPQTAAVEAAIRQLEKYSEGERDIVEHSYRTFHFADLMYRQQPARAPMDREVLAVATLLHDVGIYPKAAAELPGNDFTVRGANLARRILEQAGWTPYRIDLTAQAITINANGLVPLRWGAEAHFARLAPIVDAVGQCWKVHPDDARQVFAEHPADDIGGSILRHVAEEAARHPDSRFALVKPFFPLLVMNCGCRWHRHLAGSC
jgi:hypothetical protein